MKNLALLCFSVTTCFMLSCGGTDSSEKKAATPAANESRNVTASEAEALLKADKKIVVLDVRTPEEFAASHLPGAKNIDFNAPDFPTAIGALDRSTTYLVHCQAGGRSARATAAMKKLQFKSVLHMNEGFGGWEAEGKPVEK